MAAQAQAAPVAPAAVAAPVAQDAPYEGRPRSRRYHFKVNDQCPRGGFFTGQCMVFKGDSFYATIHPIKKRQPDGSWKLENEVKPYFLDVIDEYPIPTDPQPFARIPGAAPAIPGAPTQTLSSHFQKT